MKRTVLIAEVDPELAEMFQISLTRLGYRVLTASGGVECLSLIKSESPAVVIASEDMLWGGAHGLLDYLREESLVHRVPAVILTGNTSDDNILYLRAERCNVRYLRKPFLMGTLIDCIRDIESGTDDLRRRELSPHPEHLAANPG